MIGSVGRPWTGVDREGRRPASLIFLSVVCLLMVSARCGGDGRGTPPTAAPPVGPVASSSGPPLDPAILGDLPAVERALEQGADVSRSDPEGRTALMLAAFDGHTDVVRTLLAHGAMPNRTDGIGRTALMYASSGPFPETVEALIEAGADVNLADDHESWTALMFAAGEGLGPVVDLLLSRGADAGAIDADGDTAADHARRTGHAELARRIERATGRSAGDPAASREAAPPLR